MTSLRTGFVNFDYIRLEILTASIIYAVLLDIYSYTSFAFISSSATL